MADEDEYAKWRLDKKLPVGLIVIVLGQAFALGSWTAVIQLRVANLETRAFETANQATAETAKLEAAREAMLIRLTKIEDKLDLVLDAVKPQR